jgi:protein-S-isoprenylcysteine O-methyltransferase Ste14
MSRLWAALRAIVYMTGFVGLWGWAAWKLRALDKYVPVHFPAWLIAPGVVLILAGAALGLATTGLFIIEGRGTPAPFDPPKKFVPRGPYTLVRNPMYVGGIWLLLGFGLYLASASITLLGLAAFLLVHIFVVAAEEPGLRKRFGRDYEEYCKAVPRWIPRLTRRPGNN